MQDCPTQWGNTLSMLEYVSEQKVAIAAMLIEGKLQHLMPEGAEWNLIENLISILHPFQEATEIMSKEKYPTNSSVSLWCVNNYLKRHLKLKKMMEMQLR